MMTWIGTGFWQCSRKKCMVLTRRFGTLNLHRTQSMAQPPMVPVSAVNFLKILLYFLSVIESLLPQQQVVTYHSAWFVSRCDLGYIFTDIYRFHQQKPHKITVESQIIWWTTTSLPLLVAINVFDYHRDPIFFQCFDTVGWVIWPVETHFR